MKARHLSASPAAILLAIALCGAAPPSLASGAGQAMDGADSPAALSEPALQERIADLNGSLQTALAATDGERWPAVEALLRQRARLVAELAARMPEAVPAAALPLRVRGEIERLDARAGAFLEAAVTLSGRVRVQIDEDAESLASGGTYLLTSAGTGTGTPLRFPDARPRPGQAVSVRGYLIEHTLVVARWDAVARPALAQPAGGAVGTTGTALGEQKTAVILLEFPGKALQKHITHEWIGNLYFGPARSVNAYYREVSRGKTWVTGDVYGPYMLDAKYNGAAAGEGAIIAAAGKIDFGKYQHLVFVQPGLNSFISKGAYNTLGAIEVALHPSGVTMAAVGMITDGRLTEAEDALGTAVHEFGHGLGIHHASALDFGGEPVGPVGQRQVLSYTEVNEYGDVHSIMGGRMGRLAAPHMARYGWFTENADYLTVNRGGTFVLKRYADDRPGLKAIRVQRGGSGNAWLWLSYRQPVDGTADEGHYFAVQGATVHYEDNAVQGLDHSSLLRFNPDQPLRPWFGFAPLGVGQSWSDPYSNLTLTVESRTADELRVRVDYRDTGGVSLSADRTTLGAGGGTVAIDVKAEAGQAWEAAAAQPWLTLTSPGSGAGNGKLSLSAPPSSSVNDRWSALTVNGSTIVIKQSGIPGALAIAPLSERVDGGGASGSITVTANADDFAWACPTSDSWIKITGFTRTFTVGSGTLTYTVLPNPGELPRTGTIAIGGKVFTVTQDGRSAAAVTYELAPVPLLAAPQRRAHMAMAHLGDGRAVLYGGTPSIAGTFDGLTDTWIWTGSEWTEVQPAHNPGRKGGAAMAYDPVRGQAILFGGIGADEGSTNETWAWNGQDWVRLQPAHRPPARAFHNMVYNPVTQRIVLFGGRGGSPHLLQWIGGNALELPADTWEWDGSDWIERKPATQPPGRQFATMAFDAARNEVVLFGGTQRWERDFLGDTWAWDGENWVERRSENGPAPRQYSHMAFDPGLNKLVLFGGMAMSAADPSKPLQLFNSPFLDTWTWDGDRWQPLYTSYPLDSADSYYSYYDPVRRGIVLYLSWDNSCRDGNSGPRTFLLRLAP